MTAQGAAPPKRARPVVPPPLIALAAGFAMWAVARRAGLPALDYPGRVPLAAALAGAGLLLDLVSVAAFLRARTSVNPLAPEKASALVISGLYRVSRNPMYLGMLLILLGWAAFLAQPFALAPVALFVVLIDIMQIRPEEKALEEKFGDDYRAYKRRVRRWI